MQSDIQNQIIALLKNADSLRYSEMNAKKIDNDLYNYHLQQLVRKGWVDKVENGYALSAKGVHLVADTNVPVFGDENPHLFKVNVLCIALREYEGQLQVLNQLRESHPDYGRIGIMGGVVRKGESITDAASRKLQSETGLSADFTFLGTIRRTVYQGQDIFADVFFPVCIARGCTGVIQDTEYGKNFWVSVEQAIQNEIDSANSIPPIVDTLRKIQSSKEVEMFHYEFSHHM